MFSTSLLLLLAAASCVHCEELTQPASMVVRPDQSLTIDCKVSYSVTSHGTAWIRQPAGKALEWIGYISYSGSTYYSDKLKNKFSISRNTGTNTVTLQGQNLQTEDTAVYYCARYSGSFDYWGKGTSVTVTSATKTPPTSLLAAHACAPSSDGFLTIGCVTSGFFPADQGDLKWTGDVSDVVQYPAVQTGGTYTVVSQARVKYTDWKAEKPFKCAAGSLEEKVTPPKIVVIPPESVTLTKPTHVELDSGTATFICVATRFSPKDHTFTWTYENKVITSKAKELVVTETNSPDKHTIVSILNMSSSDWTTGASAIKCEFEHNKIKYSREAKYEPLVSEECTEIVDVVGPSIQDMLVRKAGELKCIIKQAKGLKSVLWKRGEQNITSEIRKEPSSSTVTAIAKIDYDDWSKGTEYTCTVEHRQFPLVTRDFHYKRENGQHKKQPSVYLFGPPENIQEEMVTLTCYVKDFYPKDVVVHWLANDFMLNNTDESQYRTSSPIEITKDSYSVYSLLLISAAEWESGVVFSCLVYHEAINHIIHTISRSIDNVSKKPVLVSLTMNAPTAPGC